MGSTVIGAIVAVVLGTVVGGATMIGLVSSQTAAPSQSPAKVNQPVIEYGTN